MFEGRSIRSTVNSVDDKRHMSCMIEDFHFAEMCP